MSEEFSISHPDLTKLGRSFETYAYDLERYVNIFARATGAEEAAEEAEAVAPGHAELAGHAVAALTQLYRRLDAIGGALVTSAADSEASDDAVARAILAEGGASGGDGGDGESGGGGR